MSQYQDLDVKIGRWGDGSVTYQLPVEEVGEWRGPQRAGVKIARNGVRKVHHYWVKSKSNSYPPDVYPMAGPYPEHLNDAIEFLEDYIKRLG